jgi:chemotaxis methyl-accepting protein methylase
MQNLEKPEGRVVRMVSSKENGNLLGEWFVKHTGLKITTIIREKMDRAIRTLASEANVSRNEYLQTFLNGHYSEQPLVDLIVPESSSFFQQREQMDLVVLHLIPLFKEISSETPVRILSIGCTQGEELYSLALLIHNAGFAPSLVDMCWFSANVKIHHPA